MLRRLLGKRGIFVSDTRDKGAHFFCCDFQVHTPRDRAWKGKSHTSAEERQVYARRLVEACRSKGINAIAITDHHDLCFFPHIKQAALSETDGAGVDIPSDQKLIVFPAVELTINVPCQAILILDSDFPEAFLSQVLTALTINPAPESEAKASEVQRLESITTLVELKKKLDEHDFLRDRYIVLPNVTSGGSATLLRDGVAQKYRAMPCVGGYLDGSITKCKAGDLRILAGEDKKYGNKRVALFQTSDSRSEDHSQLGAHKTWVKWAVPTAEALRQACLAQDSRISQTRPEIPSVVIRSLHVSNSEFLGPVDLYLNPQYSALIGSRGTGKSTILEYLRWGLCDEHEVNGDGGDIESVGARQQRLIDQTLKKYDATVEVRFEVNGVPHLVRRRSTGEMLLRIGDAELQPCKRDDVRTLLPVQAYSQRQLSRVGRRVDELNRFVQLGIKTELDTLNGQIRSMAAKSRQLYTDVRRKLGMEKSLKEDGLSIASLAQQADSIRSSLTGLSPEQQSVLSMQPAYFAAQMLIEKWGSELRDLVSLNATLLKRLAGLPSSIGSTAMGQLPDLTILSKIEDDLRARVGVLRGLAEKIKVELGDAISDDGKPHGSYGASVAEWGVAKAKFDASYAAAKAAASSHESQLKSLGELERKIKTVSDRIAQSETELGKVGNPEEEFRNLRKQWKELHRRRGDLFVSQCAKLTAISEGAIRATTVRGGDLSGVEDQIRAIVRGSGLRTAKIDDVLDVVRSADDPIGLWDELLDELERLASYQESDDRSAPRPASTALLRCGFSDSDISRLSEKLTPASWLELALTSLGEQTTFEYRTKEQQYIPFENASAGQQATALLISLLNQPGPPLIIDQPEDDLDNQVIFDIVKKVWRAKTMRQLVFTSHNANLVVNGDAELVVWCDYRVAGDYSRGRVADEGAIDVPQIRTSIQTVMEGGEKAFKLRSEKYGF
jgi:type III restriction enzyme